MPRGFLSIIVLLTITPSMERVRADDNTYLEQIKPLLKTRCYACHGSLKQEAGVRLDTAASIKQLTNEGKTLLTRVTSKDTELRMPPEGAPLTPAQIESIRHWTSQGAPAPKTEVPETPPTEHWAFVSPIRPRVTTSKSPIDELIDRQYVRQGLLNKSPPAKAEILLRRVYLDLIGIPPTHEQISEFISDETTYNGIVEDLLASPLFGQRWARHWMDIWRYSDWYGRRQQNDVRNSDPQIWRWRDWIIDSLNNDKSYAMMIEQMLAADELYPEDEDAWPATGYLIRSYYSLNPNEWMRHNAEYTGKAFLGLTFNCAHCHDHKYDPIAHDDYFRLRAFFEPIGIRSEQARGEKRPPEFQPYDYGGSRKAVRVGLVRIFDEQPDRPTYFYSGGDERNVDKQRGTLKPGVPDFLEHLIPPIKSINLPAVSWYPGLRDSVRQFELNNAQIKILDSRVKLDSLRSTATTNSSLLHDKLAKAKSDYEQLVAKAKENGAVAALGGNKSLYLNAGQGRRIFHHDLKDLKNIAEGTTIEFELQILKDNHVNFQLAYDTRIHRTATYIAFEKGTIRSYHPGGYKTLSIGTYAYNQGESRFHVMFTLHPATDTIDISVTTKTKEGKVVQTIPTITAALNGWDCTKNNFQPITLDCRSGTIAIYDDIRIRTPNETPLTFDFEAADYLPGIDPDSVEGWRLALAEKDSSSNILDVLPTKEILVALEAFNTARECINFSDLPIRFTEAKLAANNAQLKALKAVLTADEVRYLREPPPDQDLLDSLIAEVVKKQHQAAVLGAKASLLKAQLNLQESRQLASDDSARSSQIDAAEEEIKNTQSIIKELASRDLTAAEDYEHLSSFAPKTSSGRRAALAGMITNRQNPLTARVAVNHIWTRHFQTPLVSSPADFGRNGSNAVFPQVLDYLAVQFMEANWSLKSLHRAIVLSEAYKQTSQHQLAMEKLPPELLPCFPHKRMESEMVRDSILAIAGTLDTTPTTNPLSNKDALTTYKRSIYYETYPENGGNNALGRLFDAPSPTECYRRTTTIVPQQALVLSNSDFIHNAVKTLYQRIERDHQPTSNDDYIETAFLLILGRSPSPQETAIATDFLSGTGERSDLRTALLRVLFNHNDFVTIR